MTPQIANIDNVASGYVEVDGERFYRIANCHLLPEFHMVLASASDHWMFVTSRGALSAGRRNPDSALFPYYSADKLSDMAHCTGPTTIIRIGDSDQVSIWEPFTEPRLHSDPIVRNLYKNTLGTRVCFEEVNLARHLAFRYCWSFGHQYGFVRNCEILNLGSDDAAIDILDGFENLMPCGLDRNFQLRYSNLGDAYKKNELLDDSRLGLFYLSSIPTDRAEPSEGLRATVAWQYGLSSPTVLLSSTQVADFRMGRTVLGESDIRGRRGAYLLNEHMQLPEGVSKTWTIVANTGCDQTDVVNLNHQLRESSDLEAIVKQDVALNEEKLKQIVGSADGLQLGDDCRCTDRHSSNVLFNVMRGGYPINGYHVRQPEFLNQVRFVNRRVAKENRAFLESLPSEMTVNDLISRLESHKDLDLLRIGLEYLPFTFSRRHGDPSRPWNAFSIELTKADGSPNHRYQGNWRDIFQNWEALSLAYPEYAANMVFRFVNASTADGYNPYRVTDEGFEWEAPDPEDPWSNIGYWGDHQVVYLLKLLEWVRSYDPEKLDQYLNKDCCAYANVPYRIRGYEQIKKDPHKTIDYDYDLARAIETTAREIGSDGKLLQDSLGNPHQISLGEKLLLPALIKMTNFVPEGGIWLNTQRPEWNDANNALVGNGLSMVTVYHLRRFFSFMSDWFSELPLSDTIPVSSEVALLLKRMLHILQEHELALGKRMNNGQRRQIVDSLSTIGAAYRKTLYASGLSGLKEDLALTAFVEFFEQCLHFIDHTIRANRRDDGLYHAYNLLTLKPNEAEISHLDEMLEGQVAVLSSAALPPDEALAVLTALRKSAMYRADQQSYMLYPDRDLPRFVEKNRIEPRWLEKSQLIQLLLERKNNSIVRRDVAGGLHFVGSFRNADDLNRALDQLERQSEFSSLVKQERELLNEIFEQTFRHREFTGRSGTFFGYEGLGSIYWHMVSKLSLAAIENLIWAAADPATEPSTLAELKERYREIRTGIGLKKNPRTYGAFPTDPYSHTPRHAGAQQPGMTGQVKEDILARIAELGVRIEKGTLRFDPKFFEADELTKDTSRFEFYAIDGGKTSLDLPAGSFGFTICQVPIIYRHTKTRQIVLHWRSGEITSRDDLTLTREETSEVFSRRGLLNKIEVFFEV